MCTTQFIKELINCQNGKMVLDGYRVEGAIICTKLPCVIALLNQKNRRGKWAGIGFDDTSA